MAFRVEDVSFAIEMLQVLEPVDPLQLAEDLCIYSRDVLENPLPKKSEERRQPQEVDGIASEEKLTDLYQS